MNQKNQTPNTNKNLVRILNRHLARYLSLALIVATLATPVQQVVATSTNSEPLASGATKTAQSAAPKLYEQRSFAIEGRGDANEYATIQNRAAWSKFNPTGIYVKPGESIEVTVTDVENFSAYIHNHEARTYQHWYQDVFELKPGKNTLQSASGGVLYFSNENKNGSIDVSVEGGHFMPIFEKGVHTNDDWQKMLNKYNDVPYVELVSDYALITALHESGKAYATDPEGLLKNLDVAIDAQYKMAGYDDASAGTIHSRDRHYHHMTEHFDAAYMFAAGSHTGYARGGAMKHVLDTETFTTDGWGPWHEIGHTQQQGSWRFKEMTEVQVNIFSMASMNALGNGPKFPEGSEDYKRVVAYLNKPDSQKDYVEMQHPNGGYDHFGKLAMLWQLELGLGENFYPKFQRMTREVPVNERPKTDEERKEFFMVMSSKAAGRNLLPFFDKWGLRPTEETRTKIRALDLPILEKPIWESTETKPVREDVTIELDSDVLHTPGNKNNGNNSSPVSKPNSRPNNKPNSKPNSKPASKPNSNTNVNQSQNMLDVSIQFQKNKVQYTLPSSLHRGKFRVVAFQNGKYIGESYENHAYYSTIDKSKADLFVITPKDVTLKKGDIIEIYLMEDAPGHTLNKHNAQLLAKATY